MVRGVSKHQCLGHLLGVWTLPNVNSIRRSTTRLSPALAYSKLRSEAGGGHLRPTSSSDVRLHVPPSSPPRRPRRRRELVKHGPPDWWHTMPCLLFHSQSHLGSLRTHCLLRPLLTAPRRPCCPLCAVFEGKFHPSHSPPLTIYLSLSLVYSCPLPSTRVLPPSRDCALLSQQITSHCRAQLRTSFRLRTQLTLR